MAAARPPKANHDVPLSPLLYSTVYSTFTASRTGLSVDIYHRGNIKPWGDIVFPQGGTYAKVVEGPEERIALLPTLCERDELDGGIQLGRPEVLGLAVIWGDWSGCA